MKESPEQIAENIREQELLKKANEIGQQLKEATEAYNRLSASVPITPPTVPVTPEPAPQAEVVTTTEKDPRVSELEAIYAERNKSQEVVEAEKEIVKEIKDLPQEEKRRLAEGLNWIGFKAEKIKNDGLAKIFGGLSGVLPKGRGWKGSVSRFCKELNEGFIENSKIAEEKIEDVKSGKDKRVLGNIGSLASNTIKYGRLVNDYLGLTNVLPYRWVMQGTMLGAAFFKGAKGSRLKNEDVIEKNRIGRRIDWKGDTQETLTEQDKKDIDRAAEEAWAIYEKAGGKAGSEENTPDGEALKEAYLREMPKDLAKRLENSTVANFSLQKVFQKQISFSISGLNKKIEKIYTNKKLTLEQQKAEEAKLFKVWKKDLEEWDRMISQVGVVDSLATILRNAQKAGETAVTAMTINTIYESIIHGFETMRGSPIKHWGHWDLKDVKNLFISAGQETPATPITTQTEEQLRPAISLLRIKEESVPMNESGAVVQQGEGIEHALIRQIKNNPELAKALAKHINFEGDLSKERVLKEFAGKAAHRVALERGYVDKITGDEIHVRPAGEIAYKLTLSDDDANPFKVEEFKKEGGEFILKQPDSGEAQVKFEKGSTEEYEYVKSKPQTNIPATPTTSIEQNSFSKHVGANQSKFGDTAFTNKGNFSERTFENRIKSIGELNMDSKIESTQSPEITEELKKLGLDPKNRNAVDEFFNSYKNTPKTVEEIREEAVSKYEAPIIPAEPIQMPQASELYPEFKKDTFGLGVKKLLEVQDIYTTYVQKLSPQVNNGWNSIKDIAAHDVFKSRGGFSEKSPIMGPVYVYLNKLQILTELKPKGNWLFGREKVSEYVSRALQYAATKDGMLDQLKIPN